MACVPGVDTGFTALVVLILALGCGRDHRRLQRREGGAARSAALPERRRIGAPVGEQRRPRRGPERRVGAQLRGLAAAPDVVRAARRIRRRRSRSPGAATPSASRPHASRPTSCRRWVSHRSSAAPSGQRTNVPAPTRRLCSGIRRAAAPLRRGSRDRGPLDSVERRERHGRRRPARRLRLPGRLGSSGFRWSSRHRIGTVAGRSLESEPGRLRQAEALVRWRRRWRTWKRIVATLAAAYPNNEQRLERPGLELK